MISNLYPGTFLTELRLRVLAAARRGGARMRSLNVIAAASASHGARGVTSVAPNPASRHVPNGSTRPAIAASTGATEAGNTSARLPGRGSGPEAAREAVVKAAKKAALAAPSRPC